MRQTFTGRKLHTMDNKCPKANTKAIVDIPGLFLCQKFKGLQHFLSLVLNVYIILVKLLVIFYRIKEGILQAMVNEQETYVKNSIAQFIGTIVRHEFPNQNWPEMLQFIQQLTSSDNISDKEVNNCHG